MRRSSTADRLQRLDIITARVKSGDAMTIGDIADELGVSVRTIHRDIQLLREQGLPIDADRGRGGGVRLDRNWGVGRVNLNYAEAVDLLISLAIAEQMESTLFMTSLKSVRHKLMNSFSSAMDTKVKGLKNRILIDKAASIAVLSTLTQANSKAIRMLHQAFLVQHRIEVNYQTENGAKTKRIIEPHYLLLCFPVWYVIAWDELRNDIRTFRCDRILNVKSLGEEFQLRSIGFFEKSLEGIYPI